MHERFDRFGWEDSRYQRVEQTWLCGRSCEQGPVASGIMRRGKRCRGTAECTPLKKGDAWACSRRELEARPDGGTRWVARPCSEGPTESGACCRPRPACQPVLSLRAKRRRLATAVLAVCILGPLLLALNPQGEAFFSPGPLSRAHADLSCADCHHASREGVLAWPSHALRSPQHSEASCSCLACHQPQMLAEPFRAHGLPAAELRRRRVEGGGGDHGWLQRRARAMARSRAHGEDPLTCTSCHGEHKGEETHVRGREGQDCQVCHQEVFASFTDGHPEFHQWPHERRAPIAFDHQRHLEEWFDGEQIQCSSCHQPTDDSRDMRAVFERDCRRCHEREVTFGEGRELVLLPGPEDGLPLSSLSRVLLGDRLKDYSALPLADRQALLLSPRLVEVPATLRAAWQEALRELALPRAEALAALAKRLRGSLPRDGELPPHEIEGLLHAGLQKAAAQAGDSAPGPGEFGRRNGALVYRPRGHADPVLAAWLPLAAAYHSRSGDWEAHFVSGARSILGSCLKCHNADREADGHLHIHWSGARPFELVKFTHGPHHTGLKATLREEDCDSCHKPVGDGNRHRFTGGTGDVDPHGLHTSCPSHSDFLPISKENCATCHDRPAVPSSCHTCHRYHAGSFSLHR